MANRRTSKLWDVSEHEFRDIVQKSLSLASILRHFNMHAGAGNYKTLHSRIKSLNISTAHFNPRIDQGAGGIKLQIPLDKILIEGSDYGAHTLKKRLLKLNILKNKCDICGLADMWNNKKINHRIDHINGNSRDHRIENLRIVCPNCDSQLSTYMGRNKKK